MCDYHDDDDGDDNGCVRYNEEDIREWFRYEFWFRYELIVSQCLYVHPFSTNLSRALNFHLSLIGLP